MAADLGAERINQKMAHAVELPVLGTLAEVDCALGHAGTYPRFCDRGPGPGPRNDGPRHHPTGGQWDTTLEAAYGRKPMATPSNLSLCGSTN